MSATRLPTTRTAPLRAGVGRACPGLDVVGACWTFLFAGTSVIPAADHPRAAPGLTSLTNREVVYRVPESHHVVLRRAQATAIVVDNQAVDVPELPGHRAGYNGLASLTHEAHPANLFVPAYAGLNFEHIHDGTTAGLVEKFEPRRYPMQLRQVDAHTVEVYQPPTGNWKLESCGRYRLLEDGTIEYAFECIPRALPYRQDYIGLFWASYIHRPRRTSIHFQGHPRTEAGPPRWIEGITFEHGTDSTHGPADAPDLPPVDADFPLTLVNHPSRYVHTEPWFFGVSHRMAFVQMFRRADGIWIAQSPSGGGAANPAWDFQWFIPSPKLGEAYGFVMRAAYLPYRDHAQVERATRRHRKALNPD